MATDDNNTNVNFLTGDAISYVENFETTYAETLQNYDARLADLSTEITEEKVNQTMLQLEIVNIDDAAIQEREAKIEDRKASLIVKRDEYEKAMILTDDLVASLAVKVDAAKASLTEVTSRASELSAEVAALTDKMTMRKRAFNPRTKTLYDTYPLAWGNTSLDAIAISFKWTPKTDVAVRYATFAVDDLLVWDNSESLKLSINGSSVLTKAVEINKVSSGYNVAKHASTFPVLPGVTYRKPMWEITFQLMSKFPVLANETVEFMVTDPVADPTTPVFKIPVTHTAMDHYITDGNTAAAKYFSKANAQPAAAALIHDAIIKETSAGGSITMPQTHVPMVCVR